MYRRFLNDNDYLSIISAESLSQIIRGNQERMIQAEEAAEMSIVEYLSENYQVEAELNKGKYIAEYDRRITFPVGAHLYLNGQIYEVIRSLSGFKAPAHVEYWEESSDPNILIDAIPGYSQFKTYYPGDKAVYNGLCYECLVENGWKFGSIRMPLVNGWVEVVSSSWMPVEYELWEVVEYDGLFYTVVSTEGFDPNVVPSDSGNWGEIADYEPVYNDYELSGHEMVVRRIETTP